MKPTYNVQIGFNSESITAVATYIDRTGSRALQPFLRRWTTTVDLASRKQGIKQGDPGNNGMVSLLEVHELPATQGILQENRTKAVDAVKIARVSFVMPDSTEVRPSIGTLSHVLALIGTKESVADFRNAVLAEQSSCKIANCKVSDGPRRH